MSNEELEVYVALVAKLMQLSPKQRDLISGELQDHLQMRVEDLIDEGVPKSDAISQAVEEFGDAAVMAKNFQTVHNLKRRRWMMRFMTFSIAGSFLVAVLTMAMWPQDARFGSPSKSIAQQNDHSDSSASEAETTTSDATQRTSQTEAALKQVIDLDFEDNSFSDVKSDLAKKTGLNFILTTSALDDLLPEDETITFQINNMPLGKALDLMLAPKNATYVIDSGVVKFISLDEADDQKWLRVKMFDCRELVKVLPKSCPPVKLFNFGGGFGRSGRGGKGGFGGSGGGMFSIASPSHQSQPQIGNNTKKQTAEKKPSESQLLDMKLQQLQIMLEQEATRRRPEPSGEYTLVTLVHSMVGHETWADEHGSASLQAVNGILVVRNSEAQLKQVENLLLDLEGKLLSK